MDELKKYLLNNREHIDTDMPGEELWKGVKETLHPPGRIPTFARWMTAACLVMAIGTGVYFFTRPAEKPLAVNTTSTDTKALSVPKLLIPATNDVVKKDIEQTQPVTADTGGKKKDPVKQRQELSAQEMAVSPKKRNGPKRKRSQVHQPAPLYGFEGIEASYAAMLDLQLERVRTQPIYAEDAGYFHLFKKQFTDLAKDEEQLKQQLKQGYQETLLDDLVSIYQRKITVLKQLQFEINKMNSKVKQTDAGIQLQKPSYINL